MVFFLLKDVARAKDVVSALLMDRSGCLDRKPVIQSSPAIFSACHLSDIGWLLMADI